MAPHTLKSASLLVLALAAASDAVHVPPLGGGRLCAPQQRASGAPHAPTPHNNREWERGESGQKLLRLRGGDDCACDQSSTDLKDQTEGACGWLQGLGSPSALVAGAAIASLFEVVRKNPPRPSDDALSRNCKKLSVLLLALSFSFEIVVVFVTTVLTTHLLGKGDGFRGNPGQPPFSPLAKTVTGMLQREMELEYITVRAGFFQGLLNWILGISLQFLTHDSELETSLKAINIAIFSCMFFCIVMMIAFYNHHLTFYRNYWHMLERFWVLVARKYLWRYPIRLVPLVALIPLTSAIFYTVLSFTTDAEGACAGGKHKKNCDCPKELPWYHHFTDRKHRFAPFAWLRRMAGHHKR